MKKAPKRHGYQDGGKVLTSAQKKFIEDQKKAGYSQYDTSPTDFYDSKKFKVEKDSTGKSNIMDLTTGKPYDGGAFAGRLKTTDIISMPSTTTTPLINQSIAKPSIDPKRKPIEFNPNGRYDPNSGKYYNNEGKEIQVAGKAKGGLIMKKAPKRGKC